MLVRVISWIIVPVKTLLKKQEIVGLYNGVSQRVEFFRQALKGFVLSTCGRSLSLQLC